MQTVIKTAIIIILSAIAFSIVSAWIIIDFSSQCYESDYILINQYLDDYNSKDETKLLSCKNCLWIEAISIETGRNVKFFFAKEHELREFEPHEKITMKWCKSENGYRIIGVWNDN